MNFNKKVGVVEREKNSTPKELQKIDEAGPTFVNSIMLTQPNHPKIHILIHLI